MLGGVDLCLRVSYSLILWRAVWRVLRSWRTELQGCPGAGTARPPPAHLEAKPGVAAGRHRRLRTRSLIPSGFWTDGNAFGYRAPYYWLSSCSWWA